MGDRLIELMNEQSIGLVGPRPRAHRAHIYVLDLPVGEWAEYFACHDVRISPERDGIRVSFGVFNTADDVAKFAEIVASRDVR